MDQRGSEIAGGNPTWGMLEGVFPCSHRVFCDVHTF